MTALVWRKDNNKFFCCHMLQWSFQACYSRTPWARTQKCDIWLVVSSKDRGTPSASASFCRSMRLAFRSSPNHLFSTILTKESSDKTGTLLSDRGQYDSDIRRWLSKGKILDRTANSPFSWHWFKSHTIFCVGPHVILITCIWVLLDHETTFQLQAHHFLDRCTGMPNVILLKQPQNTYVLPVCFVVLI